MSGKWIPFKGSKNMRTFILLPVVNRHVRSIYHIISRAHAMSRVHSVSHAHRVSCVIIRCHPVKNGEQQTAMAKQPRDALPNANEVRGCTMPRD